jgi:hypothetical protein
MGSGRYPEVLAPADGGDITAGSVPLAALADLAASTVIGRNTAGTGVPEAVTMAQLSALLAVGGTMAAFITQEVDFMANVTGIAFVPARSGYYFIPERSIIFYKTLSGTFTTALTFSYGNNANENNTCGATTISAASLNSSGTTPGPPTALASNIAVPAAGNVYIDAATPITYKHTGATGGTVATGRIGTIGIWVPV